MEDFLVFGRLEAISHLLEIGAGAAGTFLALFGLGQSSAYHKQNLQWAEIDYFLQVRQVHIDTLNNMREDLRDMYEMDGRKLDTHMIVATLLLGIGFGFVVEGTFPAPDPGKSDEMHTYYQAQHGCRILYVCIAAFALLCPFWSMLALIECRRRLDFFMNQFNDKFYRMLRHRFNSFLSETRSTETLHESNLVRFTTGLPEEPHPVLERIYSAPLLSVRERLASLPCARRHRDGRHHRRRLPARAQSQTPTGQDLHSPGDFEVILALHSHYATWWFNWCRTCFLISNCFTWLAMGFNVLCCAVLLGMYFQYSYPDTPEMWRGYVSMVLLGLISAMFLTGVAHLTGPRVDTKTKWIDKQQLRFMPGWMTEDLPPTTPLVEV